MSRPPPSRRTTSRLAAPTRPTRSRSSYRAKRSPARKAARRPRRWLKRLLAWALILLIWVSVGIGGVLLWFARDLPRPEAALDASRRPSLTLMDMSGRPFATFGDLVGEPMRLADLPAFVPAAAIAIEDRRFRSHFGLDPIGILRAIWINLSSGRLRQGGSTITQQVAKTLFLTNERTFRRKVQEFMLTLWLEHQFSKDEILEIWLNRVYLGAGTWGIDAAARQYFGISARQLNLWQAAMLAGLPQAPSRFNPRADAEAATRRTREVLAAMVRDEVITEAAARQAIADIRLPPRPAGDTGWYADWAAEQAADLIPANSDAVLTTALDLRLQRVVESRLDALLAGAGASARVGQGAVVVLDAGTGAVRAIAGGRDYRAGAFNRAITARRQPGSAFKPFVWLAALETGLLPDDSVLDAPINISGWRPQNYEGRMRGEVTLEEALAYSLNTAAVRLEMEAGGPRAVIDVARRMGLTGTLPQDATLALGTGEVRLIELASAYAAFFNGGQTTTPWAIAAGRVDGRPLNIPAPRPVRVIKPAQAAMMARMLNAVVRYGTGRAAAVRGQAIGGKTGTTQENRDAWFIGWTGAGSPGGHIIAVWLGNDDNAPMNNVTGGTLPARLFHDIAGEIR